MINLLPPEVKTGYSYARRNTVLRRWASFLLLATLGLGILATAGFIQIHQKTVSTNKQYVAAQHTSLNESASKIQLQIQNINSSLKLSIKVLSQEVLFSKLITAIGAAIPQGVILTNLQIATLSSGITLTANASSYAAASQTQVNLTAQPNQVFSRVDILSINCSATGVSSKYPCLATYRGIFNNTNQYLLINQGTKS